MSNDKTQPAWLSANDVPRFTGAGGRLACAFRPVAEDEWPALHIEPVESFRLPREYPWTAIAFGLALPCFVAGLLGAGTGWSDALAYPVLALSVAAFVGSLRAGARQERRRDALAATAYEALPMAVLARATAAADLSERTRTVIANRLARRDARWADDLRVDDEEWSALRRAGPPGSCSRACGGPVPPAGGFRVADAPVAGPAAPLQGRADD
jgi:hypothetical protein